jgi:hypothetical protein
MKEFKDLEFKTHLISKGVQARMDFDSGFGVSVVSTPFSYGGNDGLYELAVFKDGEIHYDTLVANGDVQGYLTEDNVTELMIQIQKL